MREAPYTPELDEIITSSAPMTGTYHWRMLPMNGSCAASRATALSLFCELPKYWNAGWPAICGIPRTKLEYAKAKIKIVRIRATEVRGMTREGRWVSSAACEMLSRPTKEMIAKETPRSSSFVWGQ